MQTFPVIGIICPRQCGKTTLVKQIQSFKIVGYILSHHYQVSGFFRRNIQLIKAWTLWTDTSVRQ